MKLVHVYPISRNTRLESLTYFTTLDIPVGAVVSVPIRGTQTPSLVVKMEQVREAKSALRAATFTTKKITARSFKLLFSPAFIEAAMRTATYYGVSVGSVLFALSPTTILKELSEKIDEPQQKNSSKTIAEKLLLHASENERHDEYRNIVRESFARGTSVCIVVATRADEARITNALKKGIEEYVYSFHSALPKKTILSRWQKALTAPHPIVLVATGSYASLPRADIHTIIIESEGSPLFRMSHAPFIDIRTYIEHLAEAMKVRLIYADLPVRLETVLRYEEKEIDDLKTFRGRVLEESKAYIVDMKEEQKTNPRKSSYLISEFLLNEIEKSERTALLSARRGLAPITICEDCRNVVRCEVCSAAVVVHRGQKENLFVCHACGAVRSCMEKCVHCTSWKLTTLGISTGNTVALLAELFPERKIIQFDADTVSSYREAVHTVEEFYSHKGAILIGTERMIPYLHTPVPLSAVVSIDSLLSIPQWNIYERIFRMLITLRSRATETFVIQTRGPEQPILTHVARGLVSDFYKEELSLRKQFGYPPFSTLIKVSVSGSAHTVEKEMQELETFLAPFGFSGRTHLMKKNATTYEMHGFVRRDKGAWPDETLSRALQSLPHFVTVTIDPDSVL